jgi:hypothetical protein
MPRENYSIEAEDAVAGNGYTKPFTIRKRIGATNYEVCVYFSRESGESLEDKIIRLVRNEALNGEAHR